MGKKNNRASAVREKRAVKEELTPDEEQLIRRYGRLTAAGTAALITAFILVILMLILYLVVGMSLGRDNLIPAWSSPVSFILLIFYVVVFCYGLLTVSSGMQEEPWQEIRRKLRMDGPASQPSAAGSAGTVKEIVNLIRSLMEQGSGAARAGGVRVVRWPLACLTVVPAVLYLCILAAGMIL